MPKQAERDYLKNIGPDAVRHAVGRPFSDPDCGRSLIELGTIAAQLPHPPARLLDLGCGTGWTSIFFARMGYEVVGIDICADMIDHARRQRAGLDNLQFRVADYEALNLADEFDAAVFYASLHHAENEELALAKTYRALKPGSICVTCEPGRGHAEAPITRAAVEQFGVTEKDMPPRRIIELARQIGYRESRILPSPFDLASLCSSRQSVVLRCWRLLRFLAATPERGGIVVLTK